MMRTWRICQSLHSAAKPGISSCPPTTTRLATIVMEKRQPGKHSSIPKREHKVTANKNISPYIFFVTEWTRCTWDGISSVLVMQSSFCLKWNFKKKKKDRFLVYIFHNKACAEDYFLSCSSILWKSLRSPGCKWSTPERAVSTYLR